MKRGEFIKLTCTGCLLGATGLIAASSLLSCSPVVGQTIVKASLANRQISVPVEDLAGKEVTIVRSKGMDYDIAVHKAPDGSFTALLLRCTHFSNPLTPTGSGFHCNLHGSEFDGNGQVKKGPASEPLTRLPCIVTGTNLLISV